MQEIVVYAVVLGALLIVVRKGIRAWTQKGKKASGCAGCASGDCPLREASGRKRPDCPDL
jgi:hypothetical protein